MESGRQTPEAAAAACWNTAGSALAVACSAGPDSLAALRLLAQAPERRGRVLRAFHVDHRWRGDAASEKDADAVRRVASACGLAVDVVRLPPSPRGHSESEARRGRYAALAELARTHDVAHVVTAHHEDDQLETRLVALLRQSRPEAFRGIRASRPLDARCTLLRPFLGVPREALRRHAPPEALHDPTNDDVRHPRNALRLLVIPRFRSELLARAVSRFAASAVALSEAVDTELSEGAAVARIESGLLRVDPRRFAALARPARKEALDRACLQDALPSDWNRLEILEAWITSDGRSPPGVPRGERIGRANGAIYVERTRPVLAAASRHPGDLAAATFGDRTVRLRREGPGDPVFAPVEGAAFVLPAPGMRLVDGTRLVDALRRSGIAPFFRARLPVLATPAGIAWFPGMRPRNDEPPEARVATEGPSWS